MLVVGNKVSCFVLIKSFEMNNTLIHVSILCVESCIVSNYEMVRKKIQISMTALTGNQ